jgi:hypothetical protein
VILLGETVTKRPGWGEDVLEKGDIVYVWGFQKQPFRFVRSERDWYDVLETVQGRERTEALSSVKKAKDPNAESRFLEASRKDLDRRKHVDALRRDREKEAREALFAFVEFCNTNPATALGGELWERLRSLPPTARADFEDADYRVPDRKPYRR